MRPSLRFLTLAVVGWAGVRATTLGVLPGQDLFRIERSEAKAPPVVPTQFPPIEPLEPAALVLPPSQFAQMPIAPVAVRPITIPVIYAAAASVPAPYPTRLAGVLPTPQPQFYSPIPALDEWPLSRIAASSLPPLRQSTVIVGGQSIPAQLRRGGIDRVQLTAWALLRGQQGALGPSALASGGQLGGSQAGARLTYNFTRQIAASLRTTSDVGRRGGEVAAGVRIQPAAGIPLWVTAERRQRLGRYGGGRNAFALFFESGVYERPLPWRLLLDAYLQGGVVGFRSRDGFIDGAMTVSRPVYRQFSAGVGVWGGAQPNVYRVDAGPRITMRVRPNLKVHLDYRARLAGNAQPGSGPAVTLAGDF
jgi:hypothetical protein